MYHDASTAVLLDLRRRFKAVVDVLRAVIRDGVTLAQSLELTAQWDGILRIGSVFPITMQDFDMARNGDPLVTPGGSGVLADPGRIDEEFRKAWLPYFCRSGQRGDQS